MPDPSQHGVALDHPYTDPGDGRTECLVCGKWVHLVTHSCKGVAVTVAAQHRHATVALAMAASDGNTDERMILGGDDLLGYRRLAHVALGVLARFVMEGEWRGC